MLQVPLSWNKGKASSRKLAAWVNGIVAHVNALEEWSAGDQPDVVTLTDFMRPGALLTAILQAS